MKILFMLRIHVKASRESCLFRSRNERQRQNFEPATPDFRRTILNVCMHPQVLITVLRMPSLCVYAKILKISQGGNRA